MLSPVFFVFLIATCTSSIFFNLTRNLSLQAWVYYAHAHGEDHVSLHTASPSVFGSSYWSFTDCPSDLSLFSPRALCSQLINSCSGFCTAFGLLLPFKLLSVTHLLPHHGPSNLLLSPFQFSFIYPSTELLIPACFPESSVHTDCV